MKVIRQITYEGTREDLDFQLSRSMSDGVRPLKNGGTFTIVTRLDKRQHVPFVTDHSFIYSAPDTCKCGAGELDHLESGVKQDA